MLPSVLPDESIGGGFGKFNGRKRRRVSPLTAPAAGAYLCGRKSLSFLLSHMPMTQSDAGRGTLLARPAAPAPLNILVVDDEVAIRTTVAMVLSRRGHRVVEAADAQGALTRAQAEPFDLVLADLRLPGNGLALLGRLDAMPALEGRTVLMTGSLDLLSGDDAQPVWPRVLAKPFDFAALVTLVEELGAKV